MRWARWLEVMRKLSLSPHALLPTSLPLTKLPTLWFGSGSSSVHLWLKGLKFESQQVQRENCFHQGQFSVLTLTWCMVYTEWAETAAVSHEAIPVTTKQCLSTLLGWIFKTVFLKKSESLIQNRVQQKRSGSAWKQRAALYKKRSVMVMNTMLLTVFVFCLIVNG